MLSRYLLYKHRDNIILTKLCICYDFTILTGCLYVKKEKRWKKMRHFNYLVLVDLKKIVYQERWLKIRVFSQLQILNIYDVIGTQWVINKCLFKQRVNESISVFYHVEKKEERIGSGETEINVFSVVTIVLQWPFSTQQKSNSFRKLSMVKNCIIQKTDQKPSDNPHLSENELHWEWLKRW